MSASSSMRCNAVLDIPASEIEPPPSFGARLRTDFIQGMGKVNNKFVILLNVESGARAGRAGGDHRGCGASRSDERRGSSTG